MEDDTIDVVDDEGVNTVTSNNATEVTNQSNVTTPRTSYRQTHLPSAKRKRDEDEMEMMRSISKTLGNPDEEDDCAMFGGFMAETLRKLSFRVRSDVMREMHMALHKATLLDFPARTSTLLPTQTTSSMSQYQASPQFLHHGGFYPSASASASTQQMVEHPHQMVEQELSGTPPLSRPSSRPDYRHLYSL